MRQTAATGFALLIAALLAAVLIVIGLYAWDTNARAAETALRPVPVAPPALVPTPSPPLAVASPPARAPNLPLAVASPPAAPSTTGTSGDPAAGTRVFVSSCNSCHPSANAGIGPALYGPQFAQRYPEDGPLMAVIRQGKGVMPSMMQGMPGGQGKLSDQDIADVVAYLRALGSGAIVPEPTPTPRPPRG